MVCRTKAMNPGKRLRLKKATITGSRKFFSPHNAIVPSPPTNHQPLLRSLWGLLALYGEIR